MASSYQCRFQFRRLLKFLGPGLITGAADDDPSGIGTYSSVGAQFGYLLLWTMPFAYPFMATIQEISARIGRVTGHGIAGNLRRCYQPWIPHTIVVLLLFANIFNLGADLGAMAAAVNLLIGGPTMVYAVFLASISVLLQVFVPYRSYAAVLKWLTLSLFTVAGAGSRFFSAIRHGWRRIGDPDLSGSSRSGTFSCALLPKKGECVGIGVQVQSLAASVLGCSRLHTLSH
jgi:Mn2+/Fe2+ NRAMP family transporter